MAEKRKRGFAAMDREKQRQIASMGGKAAHRKGTAHKFTPEEAREAGRKSGRSAHQRAAAHQTEEPRPGVPEGHAPGLPGQEGQRPAAHEDQAGRPGGPAEETATGSGQGVSVLGLLMEACRDRHSGYLNAAEAIDNPDLQGTFHRLARQSDELASELHELIFRLGGDPNRRPSPPGPRGWTSLATGMRGQDEAAIIAECEQGEDFLRDRFEHALHEKLPAPIRAIIERQMAAVREAHDTVRALEMETSGRP